MQLDVSNYLWDPANFSGLAKQLIGLRNGVAPSPRSATDPEIFQRLIRPTPEVLVREDKRLSEALTQTPLDPELHEEAALLIGSFALRQAGACFYDVRRELSSLTAHLAIARALDQNSGPCGELAEAILSTLCGRQSAALEILQRLERNRDTKAGLPLELNTIWNRALTMRNTGDYRKLDQPEHASLLERLEYVRALRLQREFRSRLEFPSALSRRAARGMEQRRAGWRLFRRRWPSLDHTGFQGRIGRDRHGVSRVPRQTDRGK